MKKMKPEGLNGRGAPIELTNSQRGGSIASFQDPRWAIQRRRHHKMTPELVSEIRLAAVCGRNRKIDG